MPLLGPTNILNIKGYRNTIREISRPYMFAVRVPSIGTDEAMTAFARTTTLPTFTTGKTQVPFRSQNLKFSSAATFDEDWQVQFLVDESHDLRTRFLQWMEGAYNPANLTHGPASFYKEDGMVVSQLNRLGIPVAEYNFIGAFPITVGQIDLNQEYSDQAEVFDVTFSFDYWLQAPTTGGLNVDTTDMIPGGFPGV